jgi:hypothetical protein
MPQLQHKSIQEACDVSSQWQRLTPIELDKQQLGARNKGCGCLEHTTTSLRQTQTSKAGKYKQVKQEQPRMSCSPGYLATCNSTNPAAAITQHLEAILHHLAAQQGTIHAAARP